MPQKVKTKFSDLSKLEVWLKQNKKIDLKTSSFSDKAQLASMNWEGIKNKTSLLPQLKAYQRLLKILPKKNNALILDLLRANIHSAIQVASMPKQSFINTYGKVFKNKKISAESFYDNAQAIRNRLLIKHVQRIS